ncbi:MAG TPA: hypothetical protein VGO80_17235 [Solirubrobacteraceae bacterium]|jgi:hypothetical protein|nr:hypothetical protein [Solirubrobacteraceae bacterium]
MEIEVRKTCDERVLSGSRRCQRELAALAGDQHGVVARRQLLGLGFSCDQVQRMRDARRLHDVHAGV